MTDEDFDRLRLYAERWALPVAGIGVDVVVEPIDDSPRLAEHVPGRRGSRPLITVSPADYDDVLRRTAHLEPRRSAVLGP